MSYISSVAGGGLNIADVQARIEQIRAQRFASADTDGSGALSVDEFEAQAASSPFGAVLESQDGSAADLFASMDSNGDGELTQDEIRPPPNAEGAMPPPPPPPQGAFGTDTLASLLALQESSSEGDDSVSTESAQDTLYQALLNAFTNAPEAEESNA